VAGIPEHFHVSTQSEGDATVVALHGELDMSGTFVLEPQLDELVAEPPPGEVVFDLRGLSFIDSTGLATLHDSHQRLTAAGVTTCFYPGPDAVQQVFAVTGFDELLPFVEPPAA
jgi:anti-anti-sigma factor